MRKRRKVRKILLGLVLLLLLGVFWYALSRRDFYTSIESFTKDIFYYFLDFKSEPSNFLDFTLSDEKDKEIAELQSLLELDTSLSRFELLYATTINRTVSPYSNILTIDKGSDDGVLADMAVVSADGMIGTVSKVTKNYAEVSLLSALSSSYQIPVVITLGEKTIYAVLSDYSEDGTFVASGLSVQDKDIVGGIVSTSGLGSFYPSGIYLGEVSKVQSSSDEISLNAIVVPKVQLNQIRYVAILRREVE